jgi:hypothetical protein
MKEKWMILALAIGAVGIFAHAYEPAYESAPSPAPVQAAEVTPPYYRLQMPVGGRCTTGLDLGDASWHYIGPGVIHFVGPQDRGEAYRMVSDDTMTCTVKVADLKEAIKQ